ncbi:hypothetical protein RAS1_30240 [Phycisphaerae bacterium RAS1]|nr:hypothetical protein RAS1_30240 [Phycisphaerae bacterium RAS1]
MRSARKTVRWVERSETHHRPANLRRLLLCLSLLAIAATARASDAPEAVIEKWEQRWSFARDGGMTYQEIKHVRLNHERANGEFADPKIAFNKDLDTVEVKVARTRLPDGKYIDVPAYSRNEVALPGAAGWPAFAGLRQLVLTMSGIQAGCVVELEYQVTRKPGGFAPELGHELRLDHRYPITARTIEIVAAERVPLQWTIAGPPPLGGTQPERKADEGMQRLSWRLRDIPAGVDESQAPPWQTRCPRLVFSTQSSGDEAIRRRLESIQAAANGADESIKTAAAKWTADAGAAGDKLSAIQEKLAATFSVVDFDARLQPAGLRPASELLRANYGTSAEATALLLALAKAVEATADAAIVLNLETSLSEDGVLVGPSAYAVCLGERGAWDASSGRIGRAARWVGSELAVRSSDGVSRTAIAEWESADESRAACRGKLILAADGAVAGKLTIELSGLFVNAADLRTTEKQKGRLQSIVGRIIPDLQVASFAVATLAESAFVATAEVKSARPLPVIDGVYRLVLAQDDPLCGELGLPLAYEERKLPVRLAGPCAEEIDLTIEWPEKWAADAIPAALGAALNTSDAAVFQNVEAGQNKLTLTRGVRLSSRDVALGSVRAPLNMLRSERCRTLVLRPEARKTE